MKVACIFIDFDRLEFDVALLEACVDKSFLAATAPTPMCGWNIWDNLPVDWNFSERRPPLCGQRGS